MTEHSTPCATIPIQTAAEICERCSPASLGIYVVLQSLNGSDHPNGHVPCQSKIAERAHVKTTTVRRHLRRLARAGFIHQVERMKLTERQLEVLEFIERYVEEHDYAPTIEEIREGCDFGSYRTAWDKVSALERKGMIERESYKERGIRLKGTSCEAGKT